MKHENQEAEHLTKLNDELENYFNNTIIPQLFVDANLILRKFTPPAMKQFSLKKDDIGRNLQDVTEKFRFPTIIQNIHAVIASGEILEKEIQTIDKSWYQLNIIPYRIQKENRTNGVIITFVDITARIRDLKEQEKLVADHEILLDTIAHDLKNPIFSIGLSIQMFKKQTDKNDHQSSKFFENMENGFTDLKKIIDDLIHTRWQSRRYQPDEELLDIENILEDVRLTLTMLINDTKATIKQEIQLSEVVFVRRKLRSVMYNLLNNAIKYAAKERRPEIHISTYKEDEYMVISVADNGIGIHTKDLDKIFDKFQRAELGVEGSGVGLYLVKSIIENAGGKISVSSTPGVGSVFKIYLKL